MLPSLRKVWQPGMPIDWDNELDQDISDSLGEAREGSAAPAVSSEAHIAEMAMPGTFLAAKGDKKKEADELATKAAAQKEGAKAAKNAGNFAAADRAATSAEGFAHEAEVIFKANKESTAIQAASESARTSATEARDYANSIAPGAALLPAPPLVPAPPAPEIVPGADDVPGLPLPPVPVPEIVPAPEEDPPADGGWRVAAPPSFDPAAMEAMIKTKLQSMRDRVDSLPAPASDKDRIDAITAQIGALVEPMDAMAPLLAALRRVLMEEQDLALHTSDSDMRDVISQFKGLFSGRVETIKAKAEALIQDTDAGELSSANRLKKTWETSISALENAKAPLQDQLDTIMVSVSAMSSELGSICEEHELRSHVLRRLSLDRGRNSTELGIALEVYQKSPPPEYAANLGRANALTSEFTKAVDVLWTEIEELSQRDTAGSATVRSSGEMILNITHHLEGVQGSVGEAGKWALQLQGKCDEIDEYVAAAIETLGEIGVFSPENVVEYDVQAQLRAAGQLDLMWQSAKTFADYVTGSFTDGADPDLTLRAMQEAYGSLMDPKIDSKCASYAVDGQTRPLEGDLKLAHAHYPELKEFVLTFHQVGQILAAVTSPGPDDAEARTLKECVSRMEVTVMEIVTTSVFFPRKRLSELMGFTASAVASVLTYKPNPLEEHVSEMADDIIVNLFEMVGRLLAQVRVMSAKTAPVRLFDLETQEELVPASVSSKTYMKVAEFIEKYLYRMTHTRLVLLNPSSTEEERETSIANNKTYVAWVKGFLPLTHAFALLEIEENNIAVLEAEIALSACRVRNMRLEAVKVDLDTTLGVKRADLKKAQNYRWIGFVTAPFAKNPVGDLVESVVLLEGAIKKNGDEIETALHDKAFIQDTLKKQAVHQRAMFGYDDTQFEKWETSYSEFEGKITAATLAATKLFQANLARAAAPEEDNYQSDEDQCFREARALLDARLAELNVARAAYAAIEESTKHLREAADALAGADGPATMPLPAPVVPVVPPSSVPPATVVTDTAHRVLMELKDAKLKESNEKLAALQLSHAKALDEIERLKTESAEHKRMQGVAEAEAKVAREDLTKATAKHSGTELTLAREEAAKLDLTRQRDAARVERDAAVGKITAAETAAKEADRLREAAAATLAERDARFAAQKEGIEAAAVLAFKMKAAEDAAKSAVATPSAGGGGLARRELADEFGDDTKIMVAIIERIGLIDLEKEGIRDGEIAALVAQITLFRAETHPHLNLLVEERFAAFHNIITMLVDNTKERNKYMEQTAREFRGEREALRLSNESVAAKQRELETAADALTEANNKLALSEAEVTRLTPLLAAAVADVTRLGAELATSQGEVGRLGPLLLAADGEVARLGPLLLAADGEVARLGPLLAGANAEVLRLGPELLAMTLERDAGLAYVAQLQAWGQGMQSVARRQYSVYAKISEFYGGVYEFLPPSEDQNLASMPSV